MKQWENGPPEDASADGVFDLAKWRERKAKAGEDSTPRPFGFWNYMMDDDPKDAA